MEKWTLTPREAERREQEESEVYQLSMRLRELMDEFLRTSEGVRIISDEVERRIDAAALAVRDQNAKVEETRNELVDVRTQQMDVLERERRFHNGWDFAEHKFRSEHEIAKVRAVCRPSPACTPVARCDVLCGLLFSHRPNVAPKMK